MKRVGLVLLVLLGLVDLSYLVLISVQDNPAPVAIIGAVLGLVTLGAAVPAARGHRAGTITLVASRVLSVLVLDLPAYFLGAPTSARIEVSVAIVLAVAGLWLFLFAGRSENRMRAATAGQ
jgi:protein-S-isoprenylcysteine O-methyltransferase Ste14